MKGSKAILICTALLGAVAVMMGAFGAHALTDRLAANGRADVWQKAVDYQFVHVLASLALVALARTGFFSGKTVAVVGWCWLGGILLFSGSLYGLALEAGKWLGPITPLGGLLFVAGWLRLAWLVARSGGD